ncbi:putative N6-adenine methyltransferase-domain-containing protein [Flammula alnicola]|nr:putative N6-adenine methyltransferase-domain-containing protein [Flammula alnicola]
MHREKVIAKGPTFVDLAPRTTWFLRGRRSLSHSIFRFLTEGYSEVSARKIAECLHSLCTPSTKIAFLCCPTAFVAFQHTKRLEGARLLEYDQRFAVLSPKQFIPYDIDEPEDVPESLKGAVEIAVADPPFLNEVTNTKLRQTLRQILHPTKGKLILLTSTSVEDIIQKLYDSPPVGPLRRTSIDIEHGRLANDFACWGSWEGAEDLGRETEKAEETKEKEKD